MAQKRATKRNSQYQDSFSLKHIAPLNERQAQLIHSDKDNLIISGFPGTGKTFLASYAALKEVLNPRSDYERIIYIRSAVPTRNIGFLPGTDKEKVEVYEAPYADIMAKLLGRGDAYEILKKKSIVHFMSTSFVRGINLNNAIVIVDETQNMTYHELDSIITRLEDNCRIFFCGDIRQADLYKNGFEDFYGVLKAMDSFDFIEFQKEDIVRSALVRDYIIMKDKILGKM